VYDGIERGIGLITVRAHDYYGVRAAYRYAPTIWSTYGL